MKEQGRISAPQLTGVLYLGACLIPFALSRSILFGVSGVNLPLSALAAAAAQALLYFPFAGLAGRGGAARFFFAFYFLFMAVYELSLFLVFLSNVVHSGVSPFLMAAGICAAALYGAHKGIEGAARAASIVLVLLTFSLVLLCVSALLQNRIKPDFGGFSLEETAKGGLSLFSRATPLPALLFLKERASGRVRRAFLLGALLSGVLFALTAAVAQWALGAYFYTQLFPVYKLAQTLSFGPFAKMELPLLGLFLIGLTLELAVLLHLCVSCTFSTVKETPARRKSVFLFFGLFLFSASVCVCMRVPLQHFFFEERLLCAVSLVFCVLIPLCLSGGRRRAACAVLALVFALALLPGCSAETINTRSIVSAIRISQSEAGLEAQLLCADESGKKVFTACAGSVTQAIEDVREQSGKKPTLSRELILFLDPSFTQAGVFPLCDFLIRYFETAPNTRICACGFLGGELSEFCETADRLLMGGAAIQTDAVRLVDAMLTKDGVFALPLLECADESYKMERTLCFCEGAACGTLSAEETRALLLSEGALASSAVTLWDSQAGAVTLSLKNLHVSKNRSDGLDLLLRCDADLCEAQRSFYETLEAQALERFARELNEDLCKKIKAAYEKAASFRCEAIFGFDGVREELCVQVISNVNRMEEEANPAFQSGD